MILSTMLLGFPVLAQNMCVPEGENTVWFHDDKQLFKDTGVRYKTMLIVLGL